jgi:hypothetical protein
VERKEVAFHALKETNVITNLAIPGFFKGVYTNH